MKINHYSFGSITVDGSTYTKDVIIYPDHVFSPWWRKEGHLLQVADIEDVVSSGLRVLVVGTGYYGAMRVPEETLEYIRANNIEIHIDNTQNAVRLYNDLSALKPTVAALHLTC